MSFAAALSRASQRILARTGEGAFLRGAVTLHKVHVARDVEMIDAQGNMSVVKYVATISNEDLPVKDNALVISSGPDAGNYILESPVDDNGFSSRFILRKTP